MTSVVIMILLLYSVTHSVFFVQHIVVSFSWLFLFFMCVCVDEVERVE